MRLVVKDAEPGPSCSSPCPARRLATLDAPCCSLDLKWRRHALVWADSWRFNAVSSVQARSRKVGGQESRRVSRWYKWGQQVHRRPPRARRRRGAELKTAGATVLEGPAAQRPHNERCRKLRPPGLESPPPPPPPPLPPAAALVLPQNVSPPALSHDTRGRPRGHQQQDTAECVCLGSRSRLATAPPLERSQTKTVPSAPPAAACCSVGLQGGVGGGK